MHVMISHLKQFPLISLTSVFSRSTLSVVFPFDNIFVPLATVRRFSTENKIFDYFS